MRILSLAFLQVSSLQHVKTLDFRHVASATTVNCPQDATVITHVIQGETVAKTLVLGVQVRTILIMYSIDQDTLNITHMKLNNSS